SAHRPATDRDGRERARPPRSAGHGGRRAARPGRPRARARRPERRGAAALGGGAGAGGGAVRRRGMLRAAHGQALVVLVGALLAVLFGATVLGALARGLGAVEDRQGSADLAALAAARQMRADYGRLFEPVTLDG